MAGHWYSREEHSKNCENCKNAKRYFSDVIHATVAVCSCSDSVNYKDQVDRMMKCEHYERMPKDENI